MSSRIPVRVAAMVTLLCVALNGCASIVGGGTSQGVSIGAQPSNGTYTIKSSSGLNMGSGSVPAQVRLPRKNEYQIEINASGYKPQTLALTKSLNGWVWGNFVIGWLLGFAIDFIDGAAYKLEPALVNVSLQTATLEPGNTNLYAVVTLHSDDGKLIGERRLKMEPLDPTVAGVGTH